jgi:hypothetical protein
MTAPGDWTLARWAGYRTPGVDLRKKPKPPPKPVNLIKAYRRPAVPEPTLYSDHPPAVPTFRTEEVLTDAA